MNNHIYPKGVASGILTKYGWNWKQAEWKKCNCGLFHSNRSIPDIFWDKWRFSKPEKKLNDGRPKKMKYTAGIILVKNEKVWVTQSYSNCYGFIKGSYEYDENFLSAALREFKEETGSDLENLTFQDLSKCDQINWLDIKKRIQFTFLIVKVKSFLEINTYPCDDVEITSFGWYDIKKLKSLKFSKSMREINTQFIEFYTSNSYEEFYNKRNTRLKERNIEELMEKINRVNNKFKKTF